MDSGFAIRPASANDIPSVATLFRAYADTLGVDLSYQGFEAERAMLPGAYAPPAGALLIALSVTGEAVGCVGLRPLPERGCCEMKRLYATLPARGAGLGRALAVAAIAAATEAGYVAMCLDTLPAMTAAQTLYHHLGFEIVPAYYDSPVAGTIFMRRTLQPPEARP